MACSATTMSAKAAAPPKAITLSAVASRDLIETYRAEAMALFAANQAGRLAAQRIGILIVVIIGIGVGAALLADQPRVIVVLPPVVLALSALMFQQFADVSVMGVARAALEERLSDLGAGGLIYERVVAGVRKRPPLVASVRALQAFLGCSAVALTVVAAIIALSGDYRWTLPAAFAATTGPALAVAGVSYRHMLRSGAVARAFMRPLLEDADVAPRS